MPVQYLNRKAKATPKYQGSNLSTVVLPVCTEKLATFFLSAATALNLFPFAELSVCSFSDSEASLLLSSSLQLPFASGSSPNFLLKSCKVAILEALMSASS